MKRMPPMFLKKPTTCCKSPILLWIRGKNYFTCPCSQTKVNAYGLPVGKKVFKPFKSRPNKNKKGTLPNVRQGVETDFTGLPMNPFDAASWE